LLKREFGKLNIRPEANVYNYKSFEDIKGINADIDVIYHRIATIDGIMEYVGSKLPKTGSKSWCEKAYGK